MDAMDNLKPVQEVIDRWETGLIKKLKEYKSTYWSIENKMRRGWKASGKNGMDFFYSEQFINHRDRYGSYGHTAVHEGIDAAEAKIRKDGEKKLANVAKSASLLVVSRMLNGFMSVVSTGKSKVGSSVTMVGGSTSRRFSLADITFSAFTFASSVRS